MATQLAHTKSAQQLLDEFHVEPSQGLSKQQVDENQRKYGKNGTHRLFRNPYHSTKC